MEIKAVELRVGRSLEIEIQDLRVYAGRDASGEPIAQVQRALGRQSWLRLLAGQPLLSSWRIEEPLLRVPLAAGAAVDGGAALPELPPLDLEVHGGRIVLERPGAPALRVTDLTLLTRRAALPARAHGSVSGRLWSGPDPLGSFELAIDVRAGELTVTGELFDLELANLPLPEATSVRGSATGRIGARRERGGLLEADFDLELEGLEFEHAALRGTIAPRHARVAGMVSWDGEVLLLRASPLALEDLVLRGELQIQTGPGARVRASIDAEDFEPGVPSLGRIHALSLLGRRFETWARADHRTEAGRIENIHLEADLPLDGLADSLGFARKLEPHELELVASIRDGVYRISPDSPPLTDLSAELRIVGNRLELRRVRMSRGGRPLPTIDITVEGMHRLVQLPADERGTPAGPGVGIPGLAAAARVLGSQADASSAPVLQLRDFQVGYPAFVLPIRNIYGDIRFPDGRIVVDDVEAVIGGAPGRLRASYDPVANEVEVHIDYGDGIAPPWRDPGDAWASGRFSMATLPLGAWRLDQVEGELRARGATLEVPSFEAWFNHGPAQGSGSFDLASADAASFDFRVRVRNANASELTAPLERPEGSIQGELTVDGRFSGQLGPDIPFIESCDFGLAVLIEGGSFGDLPALLVLARLPSLQGIRGLFGQQLPFDAVSADLALRGGLLTTQNFALQGPELRAHARGQIDLASEDLDSDFVMAFLFLQTVDRVLGTVPIVGRWVLGKDRSLVAITLQVDGPWADPRVRPMAPGAVQTAAGWAVRVVASGANQLLRMFGAGAPDEEASEDGASAGQDP